MRAAGFTRPGRMRKIVELVMAGRKQGKKQGEKSSELEGFVLGLVWRHGPCSPYELRRQMQRSPSTQWSASAGAIYPLIQRLEKSGLLRSKAKSNGKRERREYEVTEKGVKALRAWVGPPLADEAVTVAHDPLRSRARFLEVLPKGERMKWIEAARRALDEVEKRVREWESEFGADEPGAAMMTLSGELDVKSRREWLEAVGERVG